jgi:uncharacterized membrane protein YvbJ
MIHKYYDYRRRLRWVAAFLIFFLPSQVSLKKAQENNFAHGVKKPVQLKNSSDNDIMLFNEKDFTFMVLPR